MSRYADAGVDVNAGYELVRQIKDNVKSTARLGVMGGLGSFGGMFDLSELHLKHPVLVSGTDGVGTKLMIAQKMNKHDTIGIDCVAYSNRKEYARKNGTACCGSCRRLSSGGMRSYWRRNGRNAGYVR